MTIYDLSINNSLIFEYCLIVLMIIFVNASGFLEKIWIPYLLSIVRSNLLIMLTYPTTPDKAGWSDSLGEGKPETECRNKMPHEERAESRVYLFFLMQENRNSSILLQNIKISFKLTPLFSNKTINIYSINASNNVWHRQWKK